MKRKSKSDSIAKKLLLIPVVLAAGFAIFFFVCSPFSSPPDVQDISSPAVPAQTDSAEPAPPEQPAVVDNIPAPTPAVEQTSTPMPESPTPEPPPIEAVDITEALDVTLSGGGLAAFLLDGDYTTKQRLGADTAVDIAAAGQIFSLYLIWDIPPGEWTVEGTNGETGNFSELCGTDGFIHEYIALSSPASEVSIKIPPGGATLCDIYAFSEGYPPDWVQTWLPPLEKADMLVLPTHADDEHLFFVGTMPYYAGERGYRVQVAYMTNHWNEQPRPHELLNGLWTVGIKNYPVIGAFYDRYADSLQDAQAIYGHSRVVDYHVELLRRFKPYVVVGHDLNGEYGHGAHMLNAHALRDAVDKAGKAENHAPSYEQYGIWDTPKLYLHLYSENAITMDWDIPLDSFGGATAREMAIKGYDCHISQHRWSFAVPLSGRTGSVFGLVRTLVGSDIAGGDMFENVAMP